MTKVGSATWQSLALLALIIKEAPDRIEVSAEIAKDIMYISDRLPFDGVSLYLSEGKYYLSSSSVGSDVEANRGGM